MSSLNADVILKNLHLNDDIHQILLVELEAPELTRLNNSAFKILVVNQVQDQTSSIIKLSLGKELNVLKIKILLQQKIEHINNKLIEQQRSLDSALFFQLCLYFQN